jgi:hypothetical protein
MVVVSRIDPATIKLFANDGVPLRVDEPHVDTVTHVFASSRLWKSLCESVVMSQFQPEDTHGVFITTRKHVTIKRYRHDQWQSIAVLGRAPSPFFFLDGPRYQFCGWTQIPVTHVYDIWRRLGSDLPRIEQELEIHFLRALARMVMDYLVDLPTEDNFFARFFGVTLSTLKATSISYLQRIPPPPLDQVFYRETVDPSAHGSACRLPSPWAPLDNLIALL